MINKEKLVTRVFSILFSAAMTVTVLPMVAMPVYATENVVESEADKVVATKNMPGVIEKEIGTGFDVEEIPAGGEVWYSFEIRDDEAGYYFEAENPNGQCSFSLYKDVDDNELYFDGMNSSSIYAVMDDSSIEYGYMYLKIKNTSDSEAANGIRNVVLAKAETVDEEAEMTLKAGEHKTLAYSIPASGDYDINLSSDKSDISIDYYTTDSYLKAVSEAAGSKSLVAGSGAFTATLDARELKRGKMVFCHLASENASDAALKLTIEAQSSYVSKQHGNYDGCLKLTLSNAAETDITAGVNAGKWYHFEVEKAGYYKFDFPSNVKADLYDNVSSIGKHVLTAGKPIYLRSNSTVYIYVYTTDKAWVKGNKAKITVTEAPFIGLLEEGKIKTDTNIKTEATITVSNDTEYIRVIPYKKSNASKSCKIAFSFERDGGAGDTSAALVNFGTDGEEIELCRINTSDGGNTWYRGESSIQELKLGVSDEYFIKLTNFETAESTKVEKVTVKLIDYGMPNVVSLESGGSKQLPTIAKGTCQWVKFTAPEDGFYMINSIEDSSRSFNEFGCSYYIGAKDAGSVDELELIRNETVKATDYENMKCAIDYAGFLDKDETVYIQIEATDANLTLSSLLVTAPARIDGAVHSFINNHDEKKYFYYVAPKDMPLMSIDVEYEGSSYFYWALYGLNGTDKTPTQKGLERINGRIDGNNVNSTYRYLSCPFGNIKKGDSFLLEIRHYSPKDTVKIGAVESVETVDIGTSVKTTDMNSARYYAVNITEPGYYYLSHSSSNKYVKSSLYSGLGGTKTDATYLIDEGEEESVKRSLGEDKAQTIIKAAQNYRHTTLFAKDAGNFGSSSMFNAIDGTAKLTPGTYYIKLRNKSRDGYNASQNINNFTFVFDKVQTISNITGFEADIKADTPAVFEYTRDLCKDNYYSVVTQPSVSENHIEVETKDVSAKKDGSKLKERESGEALYNAFEVVGVERDTKINFVDSLTRADLKDISVDTWVKPYKTIGTTTSLRAVRSYEAILADEDKKFVFDFSSLGGNLEFSVNATNTDGTEVSADFKNNYFVRVQLYKDGEADEFSRQDWYFDDYTVRARSGGRQTFSSVGEYQSYRIRATLYKKADGKEYPIASLISDSSKDENGEAVSNQMITYGRVVVDKEKLTPVIGTNYACLQFVYLAKDVSKILLREKGTEKYTVWTNHDNSDDRFGKWIACPQVESRKKYGYGLTPGTTYEILFLNKNNEYDGTNVGKTYFYEEDIITPQYKDGTPIEEPLTFTTKACEEAKVTVLNSNSGRNFLKLPVVLSNWDTFLKYPYPHEGDMYFNEGFFNASKLKLEGNVTKSGSSESRAFACSVDVNTVNNGSVVTWSDPIKEWRWGDAENPKCEILYNGDRMSTITVYYTLDELEADSNYTISDLKLTYYGKELEISAASKENQSFTTLAADYSFDYTGDSENNAYIGDFRVKVPVEVTAPDGVINTGTYDYKLKMKLQDAYGNDIGDVEAVSTVSQNGISAEFDTKAYGALKPNTKYYIHSSLLRKDKNKGDDTYESKAEDKHSFITASAKNKLTLSANGLPVVGTSATLAVDLSADEDAKALLESGKSLKDVIHYYVKDITGKADQPAAVQLDESSLTETAAPFTIKFENLKPNTQYVGYIADSAEGEHISECEFTTGNKVNAINVKVIPKLTGGSLEVNYTGAGGAGVGEAALTDWKEYSSFWYRINKGNWQEWKYDDVESVDGVLKFTKSGIDWWAGCKYDYFIALASNTDSKPSMAPGYTIENIKNQTTGKDNRLLVENGIVTPANSPYEVDYDTTMPGGLSVSYSAADNINTVSLKLGTPGDLDRIKVVAQIAEEDDKGNFKNYSENEEIKAEAIFSKENDYAGELSFENLRKNVTYYLMKVYVYADLTDTEEGYESLIKTISFSAPFRAPMFISGTDDIGDYSQYSLVGLWDRQDTGKKDSEGKTIYRGYDGVQDKEDANVYTVAFNNKGDKYELKLADRNGNYIGDILSWFDVRIVESKLAVIAKDEDSSGAFIQLKRTGETKIIITPKSSEKYRQCQAKEITLKINKAPKWPSDVEIYALTDVQKKLSDIDLMKYGYGAEWTWSEPDTVIPSTFDDTFSAEGAVCNFDISIKDEDTYYPFTISQCVKPRRYKDFNIEFIDSYEYKEAGTRKKIQGEAQISDDGKIAAVYPATDADRDGALVSIGFDYYGQGKNDKIYTFYEWEELPGDVIRDTSLPYYDKEGRPMTEITKFIVSGIHNDGVRLKLKKLYLGHYDGDDFICDVDLIERKLISTEKLEQSALTLYVKNDPVVGTIKIMADVQDEIKNLTGRDLVYNAEVFEGTSIVLTPVFCDSKRGKIASSKVDYSFTSTDPDFASVEAKGDGKNYLLNIKKQSGYAVIKLAVNDGVFNKTAETEIRVGGFEPWVSTNNVTINTAYDFTTAEGKALAEKTDTPIEAIPLSGTIIDEIEIAEDCIKDENGKPISYTKSEIVGAFRGNKENHYFVKSIGEMKKKKTYHMIVKVKSGPASANSETASYVFPLTVTPKERKVKVSAKSIDNYNYFFVNGEKGKIAVTLKGTPYLDENDNAFGSNSSENGFEWKDTAKSAEGGFIFNIDTAESGKKAVEIGNRNESYTYNFSFSSDNLEVVNKKLKMKELTSGQMTLYLKGYKDPLTVNLKLPVKYQKPKLKIYSEAIVTDIGVNNGRFVILDGDKNVYGFKGEVAETAGNIFYYDSLDIAKDLFAVTKEDQIEKIVFADGGKDIDWTETRTGQKFSYSGTKKSDSTKLTLNSANWREKLSATLKVKTKTPYLNSKKGYDKMTFNTLFESEYYSMLETNLSDDIMKNLLGDITAENYDIVASNIEADKLLDSNILTFKMKKDENSDGIGRYYIQSSITKPSDNSDIKTGKYIYQITPKVTYGEKNISMKPLRLTINITNKTPKVVYTLKGSVDSLAVALDAISALLKNCKSDSKAVSTMSKYTCVLVPKLIDYPSGSEVDIIKFSGDNMSGGGSAGTDDCFLANTALNPATQKYMFTYLIANKTMETGKKYGVNAAASIRIGSNDQGIRYTADPQKLDIKVIQSKPKVSVVKGSDGKTLYMNRDDSEVSFELEVPDGYIISDIYGELDINKDKIKDVEVKAAKKEDGSINYFYGEICRDSGLSLIKKKKISVPVTVKFKGRDGVTADSSVKISFVLDPK